MPKAKVWGRTGQAARNKLVKEKGGKSKIVVTKVNKLSGETRRGGMKQYRIDYHRRGK